MGNSLYPPKPFSLWEKEVYAKAADVLIVGAGITGLATACSLLTKKPGLRVKIVDSTIAPAGASTRNAGFACFGTIGELLDDMQNRSEQEVWGLVEQRWEGLKLLTSLIPPAQLFYEQKGGGEVFLEDEPWEKACDYIPVANRFMKEITGQDEVFQKDTVNGLKTIRCSVEGMLHSGHMIELLEQRALVMGAGIRRGYAVTHVEAGAVEVAGIGKLHADKIVLATNGYTRLLDDQLPIDPARGYVLVTTPQKSRPWEGTFHYDRGYVYFRSLNHNRLLIGGCRNLDPKTEATTQTGINPVVKNGVLNLLKDALLPEWDGGIEQEWTGIMGFGPDKLPVIEEVKPGVLLAAGLSGMGVALGSLIGRKVADKILGSRTVSV